MANGLFDDKKKAEIEAGIDKMIAAGKSDDEIQAYIDQEKAKLDPAQAQQGAPAQADAIQDDTASNVAPGSSVSPEEAFETAGAQVAPETPIKDDAEIGGWENLKNNVYNVYNRILGFDDRLNLAAVDTFEALLGKEAAEKMYKAMPNYDPETGQWLDTPDEVREAVYRELAQTQAQNKQTVGLIDAWENGDAGQVLSAAAGAGLNLLSTMITSTLTLGAGLYTDMVADAIVDANNTKAETMGISTKELYERGENEFMLPATVGIAGGLLERMGIKGVNKYISSVASKNIGGAVLAMANNSGKEGLTEWLQYGLETYNNEKAKGNDEAAQKALDNLFTREGAEMALQGAVGALVGGTAGKAGKRALGISQGVAQTSADELSEVQDTPEYGFDPKTSESKYKSKVKATEDAAEAGLEQEEVTPEQAAEMERAKKREKESQNRETRRLVQELEEEYEGTAQELNPTDKTAYVLRGLERDAGIKTVDEAADLSKSRQRDVMHLVTKASVGLRSAEETAKLDKAQENIYEASKILENTTDPAQQEALQLYIDDEKDKVANTITNYNRKVLLASPTAVANAVEAANELDRLSTQEQNIQNNGQLPDAVKQSMLDNIQDRKSAAYQKGETARAEIEKSAAQNADLVDDNSKYLAQLLDEEIADNEKKTDAIVAEASDLGLVPDPDGDLVTDDSLSEGRQAISGENGVKEYGKTFGGNFGSRTEAIQAGIKLQQSAKTKGYKANVEYIDVNPERPGGDTQVVAEIYSPRQENVVESVNKLKNQQQAELEETDPVQAELDEAAEAVQEEERTPTDYVKDFAPEAQETALDDGSIFLPGEDAKSAGAYRAVGGLKKRGHKDAKFEQIGGGFLVRPGERETGEQIEYNIDEDGRAHDAEGKFAPKSQSTEVARVKALPLEAEDGATFNLDGTVYEEGGLVVPIASKNMKASELTDEAIENFKTKYKDYMGPASKVGIYKFPGQDQVSIDLNVIAPDSKRAEAIAIGKRLGQESLFSLDTFENIKTGETGANPVVPTAAQARNISEKLGEPADRSGAFTPESEGIAASSIINPAQPGESYIKVPFEKKGAVVSADKSIGGKGGFASTGDARESITTSGAGRSAVDFMKGLESAWSQSPNNPDYKGLRDAVEAIRDYSEGANIPAFSKIAYRSSGALTKDDIRNARAAYDRLAGYRGAHKNLDNAFAISKVPTINLPKKKAKTPDKGGQQIRPEQLLSVTTPTDFKGNFGRPVSVLDYIQADKELEPNIILGKDAKKALAEKTDEELADVFDRYLNSPDDRRATLRDDLGPQPEVTDSFVDFYNDGQVSDTEFISALANYVAYQAGPSKDLQGFALGKFVDDVVAGKFKDKNIKQVFAKAKGIAKGAKQLQRTAYGINKRAQADQNTVRKAEQAFFAKNGYAPGLQELADFINSRYPRYKEEPITAKRVENVKFEEVASGVELGGVQGNQREVAQTRIAKEAGLDTVSDAVFANTNEIDQIADDILSERPIGDDQKRLKSTNTLLDQDLRSAINSRVKADQLRRAFPELKELFGLTQESFDSMDKAQKRAFKNNVVRALAQEAENRLGKTQTPSQELDFSIEEGSATRNTDMGVRSKLQVNSHRQPWSQTAKELNRLLGSTNFNNDWVQWSPGQLGNLERGRAKGIPDHVLRELNKQPARVAKLASKYGASLRQDTNNPGVYHIYKPGKIGSKPDFSLTEKQASSQVADPEFVAEMKSMLEKAWPDHKVIYNPKQFNDKVNSLQMSGISAPWSRMKGFVTGNEIYLNPSKVGYDTPIHEFAHVWEKQLQISNPKLWKRGVELLKGSEYARVVYDNPTYRAYLKKSPSKFWGEVMANAIGKRGAVLFSDKKKAGTWDKWMKKFGDWIKDKLNISTKKDYQDLTLNDWLDVAVHGTLTGKTPKYGKTSFYRNKGTYSSVENSLVRNAPASGPVMGRREVYLRFKESIDNLYPSLTKVNSKKKLVKLLNAKKSEIQKEDSFANKDWNGYLKEQKKKVGGAIISFEENGENKKVLYLDNSKPWADTPIHEMGHLFYQMMSETQKGRDFLNEGMKLLSNSKWMDGQKERLKRYKYSTSDPKYWEEVFAGAIGVHSVNLFDKSQASTMDKWGDFLNKVKDYIQSILGINSNYDADSFLSKSISDILQGEEGDTEFSSILKTISPPNISFSIQEDPTADPDIAAAYLRGKSNRSKWYNPNSWAGRLIPPAADDYHGLISRLKNISGIDEVTRVFQKNHKDHISKVTKAREAIKAAQKALGTDLDTKNVTTLNGNRLTAAQAIQAHVDGFPNSFSKQPKVKAYIKAMTDMGVLKPSEKGRYDLASPAQDTYRYLNNDLYEDNFQEFNEKKAQIFNDDVMQEIIAEHGEKYADALQKALQRMSSGKNSTGFTDKTTQKWNDWALGSVGTIMFLNFRSAALQMLSVGNFGFESKNPGKFIASFFDPSTFAEAKKLYNDPYLKERRARAGFDVNAQEMIDLIQNSKTFSDFTKKVLNKGFAATSFVDSVAIAMGGAAFMKSGGTREQWIEATEEAQQSARPDRVSQWQTEGISKFVLAFANTPQQYFRLSQKAFRSIREGKDVKRNLAKIGYYMVAQNMIFTAAQAASTALLGFGDDDDDAEERDQLNSMAGTILRGMGLYGAVIDAAKNVIVQAIKEEGKARPDHVNSLLKAASISPPLNRKMQDLMAIGRGYNYDSDDKHVTAVTRGTAFLTNLPSDWAHKKFNAVKNLSDDQFTAIQKLLMLAGWSEWNFKDSGEESLDLDLDLDLDDLDLDDLDLDL